MSRQKLNYLLAGLLECACGSTMNGTSNGKRRHYVCRSHLTRPKALADWPTGCRAKPYVNAEALDERVWGELSAFVADPVDAGRPARRGRPGHSSGARGRREGPTARRGRGRPAS